MSEPLIEIGFPYYLAALVGSNRPNGELDGNSGLCDHFFSRRSKILDS